MNTIVGFGATLFAPRLLKGLQDQKVKVLHASPGRLRLQCDKWKNNVTARLMIENFASVPLVDKTEVSPVTGSLLLLFKTQTLTQEQFDEIVKTAVESSVAAYNELPSNLNKVMQHSLHTVDIALKRQSGGNIDMDGVLSAMLLFTGIATFPANPAFASSMLYWSYSIIKNQQHPR